MNKEINKINDNELEDVTGGSTIASDHILRMEGGICPINGKYCKHGRIDSLNGTCLKAKEGIGITAPEHHLNPDGIEAITMGEKYTFYKCDYINDQE